MANTYSRHKGVTAVFQCFLALQYQQRHNYYIIHNPLFNYTYLPILKSLYFYSIWKSFVRSRMGDGGSKG